MWHGILITAGCNHGERAETVSQAFAYLLHVHKRNLRRSIVHVKRAARTAVEGSPLQIYVEVVPFLCHCFGMTATIKLDVSNRIVLPRDLRRAAGISPGQKLKVSATPGRIVIEMEPNEGKVVKRGKLKLWTGKVPSTPLEEAVEQTRHYER